MNPNPAPLAPQVKAAVAMYLAAYREGLITASEMYHWTCTAVAANDHPETLDIAIALAS